MFLAPDSNWGAPRGCYEYNWNLEFDEMTTWEQCLADCAMQVSYYKIVQYSWLNQPSFSLYIRNTIFFVKSQRARYFMIYKNLQFQGFHLAGFQGHTCGCLSQVLEFFTDLGTFKKIFNFPTRVNFQPYKL